MNNTISLILWLILAALVGWLWFGPWYPAWQYYFCPDCYAAVAGVEGEEGQAGADALVNPYALAFKWSDPTAYTTDKFEAFKASILEGQTADNILEITGLYYEGEPKPAGADNYGFARAEAIRALFPEVPAERIKIRARTTGKLDEQPDGYFEGAVFQWQEAPKEEVTAETEEKVEVEELADRGIVRFPYNSTRRISDPQIDVYLDKLSERVKTTGEQVRLTGHTDNIGDDEFNQKLGMQRAQAIEQLLLEKGVPAEQIVVESKGRSQPVAPNDTEAGRRENRRVEVRFIKKN